MRPLKSDEIYGNWATVLLPIEQDDSINYGKLSAQVDQLIAMNVNGIYSNGTASEFYNQTEEEFDAITEILAEKCTEANMPFQIGCTHMSPKLAIERVKRAVALKPGAIQVILPDWFPPSMPEIISYLKKMVETAGDIGLVLYNPGHAKKKLLPRDFYEIKQAGIELVGYKLAGGDANWYAEMNQLVPDISLFTPGHRLATGIGLGAKGAYSNVACIHPGVAQRWYEMILTDKEKALELEKRIQVFITNHIYPLIRDSGYSDPAVDKLMACITGWADLTPRLRWPYSWIKDDQLQHIRNACREIIPEFFAGHIAGSPAPL